MAVPFPQIGNADIADQLFLDDGLAGDLVFSEYFDAPAAGSHSLTASGINAGLPTVGSPTIAQAHSLSASGIAAGAPTVGTPAASQSIALTASGVATGAPTVGGPAVSQIHGLAAAGIGPTAPTVGIPAPGQAHVLTATGIASGNPTVGAPSLTLPVALSATGIATASPTVASPALAQTHAFVAVGVTATPVLDQPALDGSVPQYSAGPSTFYRRLRDEGPSTVPSPPKPKRAFKLVAASIATASPTIGRPALTEEFDGAAMDIDLMMIAA